MACSRPALTASCRRSRCSLQSVPVKSWLRISLPVLGASSTAMPAPTSAPSTNPASFTSDHLASSSVSASSDAAFYQAVALVSVSSLPIVPRCLALYSSRVPLITRLKSQPRKAAARRHITMRDRKISKYSMTCETVVSMSSESVIVRAAASTVTDGFWRGAG